MVDQPSPRSVPAALALIGCGRIGRVHAERVAADGRARIVALCDPDQSLAESVREAHAPGAALFTSLPDLLDTVRCDAALVCSPTQCHHEQVRELLSRGIPTLCEKPLADTRARAAELIAMARDRGVLLSLAYQCRSLDTFRTLRREVQSGRWGPLRSIALHSTERWQQTIAGTWRADPQFNPGGFLGDAGSHPIDMVLYLSGMTPSHVFARTDHRGSPVNIVTTVIGELDGGVSLSMTFLGDAQHWRQDFHLACRDADLLLREGQVWIARNNEVAPLLPLEPASDPNRSFLDTLLEGAPDVAPAECALAVWDFTQAILTSAREGRAISPNIGKEPLT